MNELLQQILTKKYGKCPTITMYTVLPNDDVVIHFNKGIKRILHITALKEG